MTSQNQVILEGEPAAMPVWSHENHGIRFYRFLLRVPRLSGQQDLLPVLTPESNLNAFMAAWEGRTLCPEQAAYTPPPEHFPETYAACAPETYAECVPERGSERVSCPPVLFSPETSPLSFTPETSPLSFAAETPPLTFAPEMIRLSGQFRSFNNRSGTGSRLILSVYAQQFQSGTASPCNQILLSGTLCKPPSLRRTPLGRSICDLMLAVPRHYGRADYLPVIAWGQLAVQTSEMHVGDTLELEGRVQSRIYHKVTPDGVEQRTAYEISMMHRL